MLRIALAMVCMLLSASGCLLDFKKLHGSDGTVPRDGAGEASIHWREAGPDRGPADLDLADLADLAVLEAGAPDVADLGPPDRSVDSYLPPGCTRPTIPDLTIAICSGPQTWKDAAADCGTMFMELAHIASNSENAAVRSAVNKQLSSASVWLGGSDQALEGRWTWPGGNVFWASSDAGGNGGYANWNPGEPNNAGNEDCLEMRGDGTWNDVSCSRALAFVCRK